MEDAGALFSRCLAVGSWHNNLVRASDGKRWHGLSALLRMLLVQHQIVRMQIRQLRGQRLIKSDQSMFWGTTSQIKEAVEQFSRRLQVLVEDHDLLSHGDTRMELRMFKREVEETLAAVYEVQGDAERLATKKSVDMSEITISESRNAVACQLQHASRLTQLTCFRSNDPGSRVRANQSCVRTIPHSPQLLF